MNLQYGLEFEDYKYKAGDKVDFNSSKLTLVCGKRDWAAFQLLLKADEDFTVSVGTNPVFTPAGPLTNIRLKAALENLPGFSVDMKSVGMIDDDDGVNKADVLLPNEMVHVEAGKIQPVWVEISIPHDAKPGVYKGSMDIFAHSMFEDERKVDTLSFEIDVKDVVIPSPAETGFHLDLWQHLSNISRKHEVILWSDEHFRIVEEYVKSISELGQKAITIIASEIPWSGQFCFKIRDYLSDMFEYNMVRVEKDENGHFVYDYSIIQRYIELCFKYGIDREIEIFGLINIWVDELEGYGKVAPDHPDSIRIRYYDRADECYKFMKSASEIKEYIKALEGFFIEKGLIDRVLVVADEPADVELYKQRLSLLKEVAPAFKYKTAIYKAEFIDEFKKEINDYVPILNCVCAEWDLLNQLKDKIQGRMLWYVCCAPDIPNTFIASPLLESRLIGILTAYMKFDGFLRWNYTVWPENPRERISFSYPRWKAGDTNFVYPSKNGSPVLSLRYKNFRRGMEDFRLIELLRNKYPDAEDKLDELWDIILKDRDIRELHPDKKKAADEIYSLKYEDYNRFKRLLLDFIQAE